MTAERVADGYTWLPRERMETPSKSGMANLIRDSWWVVNAKGEVALYRGRAPQCNSSRIIAEKIGASHTPGYAGVVFIPLAFLPHRCEDYS